MKNQFLFILLISCAGAFAQNARFSQQWSVPAQFNPALVGRFDGKARLSVTSSWQRADSGNINHQNISAEFKLGRYKSSGDEAVIQTKFSKKEAQSVAAKETKDQVFNKKRTNGYWSGGVNYYHYGYKDCPIDANFIAFTGARHFYNRSNKMYGLAAQIAFVNGKLDETKGTAYEKEISGGGFRYPIKRNSASSLLQTSSSYTDINIGAYYAMNSEIVMFELGAALHHITSPVIDITKTDNESRMRRKVTAHALFRLKMNETWGAVLRNMYSKEGLYYRSRSYGDSLEIVCFWTGLELYKVNPAKNYNFNFGMYSRSFKTFMPYLNFNLNNFGTIRYSHEEPFNSKNFKAYNASRDELTVIYSFGRNTAPGTRFYKKMQYW